MTYKRALPIFLFCAVLVAGSPLAFAQMSNDELSEEPASVAQVEETASTRDLFVEQSEETLTNGNVADMVTWVNGLTPGEHTLYVSENVALGNAAFIVKDGVTLTFSGVSGSIFTVTRSSGTNALFNVQSGGTLLLENITIDGGGSSGGASFLVDNAGTSEIRENVTLCNNTKKSAVQSTGALIMSGGEVSGSGVVERYNYDGGGITINDGTFEMSGGIVSGNTSTNGGGVALNGGSFTLSGGNIEGNSATVEGGGVYVGWGTTFVMADGSIASNTAGRGGGVVAFGSTEISGGSITHNEAKHGGGMYVSFCLVEMNGGDISSNRATSPSASGSLDSKGGGIYLDSGAEFIMTAGTLSNNEAKIGDNPIKVGAGGGIYNTPVSVSCTIAGGIIKGNSADIYGGGIYSAGPLEISGKAVVGGTEAGEGNVAPAGGGIFATSGTNAASTFTIAGEATIVGNEATSGTASYYGGGGVYVTAGCNLIMSGGGITGNKAVAGGGIYCAKKNEHATAVEMQAVELSGGIIDGNNAENGGGLFVDYGTDVTLSDAIKVTSNTATSFGGGVYIFSSPFTMSGGEVSENIVSNSGQGGGIFYQGSDGSTKYTFHLSGGAIKKNKAQGGYSNNGGGVSVNAGNLLITGGVITENEARNGNGVYVPSAGTLQVSGTPSVGINDDDNGVFLGTSSKVIAITEPLIGDFRVNISGVTDSKVGRVVAKKDAAAGETTEPESGKFFYQPPDRAVYTTLSNATDYVLSGFAPHPQDVTVYEGSDATFSATLAEAGTVTLSWEVWDTDNSTWQTVPGENTTTLTVDTTRRVDDGALYRCVATYPSIVIPSRPSCLTVRWIDIDQSPSDQTVPEGGQVQFSVGADSYPASLSYQWEKSSDDGNSWIPLLQQTDSSLTLEVVAAEDHASLYRCAISNGTDTVYSDAARLRVFLLVDPANNSFSVDGGLTQTAGKEFTVAAIGHRQDAQGVTPGDERYIPLSVNVVTEKDFPANAPYAATMTISDVGTYTITVTYQLQRWDGASWQDVAGSVDTKTATLEIRTEDGFPENKPTGIIPKTGESNGGVLWLTLALSSAFVTCAGVVLRRKRRG